MTPMPQKVIGKITHKKLGVNMMLITAETEFIDK
jgi:hypothetical protein